MPLKLRKVISGGQTGADKTGLICAKALGLETGGTAPKGYRTDEGPDFSLRDVYGLVEHASASYPPRTAWNVRDSDVTLWFGNVNSPGGILTAKLCLRYDKPFISNPDYLLALARDYAVWNIAGNRQRTNPKVVAQVQAAFKTLCLLF